MPATGAKPAPATTAGPQKRKAPKSSGLLDDAPTAKAASLRGEEADAAFEKWAATKAKALGGQNYVAFTTEEPKPEPTVSSRVDVSKKNCPA